MLIALMTRIPEPGKTKTRLQTHLTGEECANLHKAFLQDMISMLMKTSAQIKIFHTTEGNISHLNNLLSPHIRLIPQRGNNLGEKMYNALKWGKEQGFSKVAVLGTDLPSLQPEIIEEANRLMDSNDVVIGPTPDGGYYFLGMKQLYPEIFKQTNWGTSTVLQETVNTFRQLGLKWAQLPECNDIDYFNDLVKLKKEIEKGSLKSIPINTYGIIKNYQLEISNTK